MCGCFVGGQTLGDVGTKCLLMSESFWASGSFLMVISDFRLMCLEVKVLESTLRVREMLCCLFSV